MIKNKIEKLLLSTLPPYTDLKREKKLITNGFLDSFSKDLNYKINNI